MHLYIMDDFLKIFCPFSRVDVFLKPLFNMYLYAFSPLKYWLAMSLSITVVNLSFDREILQFLTLGPMTNSWQLL